MESPPPCPSFPTSRAGSRPRRTSNAPGKQRELNHLKSRFVAMTSHEFRTPLATILSSAELLKFYGAKMSAAEQTEILESIDTSVKRMTKMLDDVLLIGKVEAEKPRIRAQTRSTGRTARCHRPRGSPVQRGRQIGKAGGR